MVRFPDAWEMWGWPVAEIFWTNFRWRTQWQHKSWSRIKIARKSWVLRISVIIQGHSFERLWFSLVYVLKMVRIRSGAFVLPYRVGRCRCHEICRLDANFNVFGGQFWIIFDAKCVHFWVSKAFGQMLRNKRPKFIENEVVNAKKVFRLGTFSEQKWVCVWMQNFSVF